MGKDRRTEEQKRNEKLLFFGTFSHYPSWAAKMKKSKKIQKLGKKKKKEAIFELVFDKYCFSCFAFVLI